MATITQTVEETLTFTAKPAQKLKQKKVQYQLTTQKPKEKLLPKLCPPDCKECQNLCPADCEECKNIALCPPNCKAYKPGSKFPLLFNAIGIIIAMLATYLMITTDSKLYLVFWVCYSVLRRMMTKSKPNIKTE